MPNKLLIITPHFYPENFKINDLTTEFIKKGYELDILTSTPHYPKYSFYKNIKFFKRFKDKFKGCNIFRIPVFPRLSGNSFFISLNYLSFILVGIFFSLFLTLNNKYKKIFIFQVSPITVIFLTIFPKLFHKSKSYIWILDLWPESVASVKNLDKTIIPKILKPISDYLYNKCDFFFISSPAFKENLIKRGISHHKIYFLPQWTEESYFKSNLKLIDEKRFKIFEEKIIHKKTFLFAGNIGEAQDIPNILNAINILNKNYDCCFVFLGDGSKINECKKIKSKLNLNNVFFLGRVDMNDVKFYIEKSDFMIISLISKEIFKLYMPAKFQTYLSLGKPIVSSCDGVINDLVDKYECGISCKSSNSNELANSFNLLLTSNASQINKYSNNSINLYNSSYKKEIVLELFFKQFELY